MPTRGIRHLTKANIEAARQVARLCSRLAKRNDSDDAIDAVAVHIVLTLAPIQMKQLVAGDWRRSHWAAMKLTLPFFRPT